MQPSVESEHEEAGAWRFRVRVSPDRTIDLRLSWPDYNQWSPDGSVPPSDVARAVLSFLLSRTDAASIRSPLDAGRVRRRHADADSGIIDRIRKTPPDGAPSNP